MWAEIKKFLNSTIGKNYSLPLDVLDEKRAYKTYSYLKKFISPPIKQIGNHANNFVNYSMENFIEYGIESLENPPSRSPVNSVLFIPSTIKNIANNAFRYMNGTVVIDNKSGNINGYPWGHQTPERILFLRD